MQIKVKWPDGTNVQISAFGQGNNKEYLIHGIAVKWLLEQKWNVQDIGKAFEAISEVRKQLEPLHEASKDGTTKTGKDKQKKQASTLKEELKTTHEFAGVETLKAYELFCCFVVGEVQTQLDKIIQVMHCKTPG
jgi:hypothetical protein